MLNTYITLTFYICIGGKTSSLLMMYLNERINNYDISFYLFVVDIICFI